MSAFESLSSPLLTSKWKNVLGCLHEADHQFPRHDPGGIGKLAFAIHNNFGHTETPLVALD
jgi:hypothetical protein